MPKRLFLLAFLALLTLPLIACKPGVPEEREMAAEDEEDAKAAEEEKKRTDDVKKPEPDTAEGDQPEPVKRSGEGQDKAPN